MIVVSDTSPFNYLVLIDADHILPVLFGRVMTPPQVLAEMQHTKAPAKVHAWAKQPPPWVEVLSPLAVPQFAGLGPGESAAIALAQECQADVVLIDERDGTAVARQLGLVVTGTLAILFLAAERDLISLPVTFEGLEKTSFRGPKKVMDEMLRLDADRIARKNKPANG